MGISFWGSRKGHEQLSSWAGRLLSRRGLGAKNLLARSSDELPDGRSLQLETA